MTFPIIYKHAGLVNFLNAHNVLGCDSGIIWADQVVNTKYGHMCWND